jgi:hypothetical protein
MYPPPPAPTPTIQVGDGHAALLTQRRELLGAEPSLPPPFNGAGEGYGAELSTPSPISLMVIRTTVRTVS